MQGCKDTVFPGDVQREITLGKQGMKWSCLSDCASYLMEIFWVVNHDSGMRKTFTMVTFGSIIT